MSIQAPLPRPIAAPPELRRVLRVQATLRVLIGIPMTAVWIWLHYMTDQQLQWATIGVAIYCSYAAGTWVAARFTPDAGLTTVLYATAVLDAAVLIFWLPLVDDAAGFIVGLALFTGLGYGLRTGNKWVMLLNQAVTLVGYIGVLALTPEWLKHPVRAIAFAVPLVIVPLYVALLLDSLHAARQRAQEESEAKSDMLAKVSHELRTPLGGIVSAADLIHMNDPDAPSGRLATTILGLAKHLQDDIADLLDQAKHSAKALILNPGVCDIRELLGTVEAAVRAKAAEKHVALQVIIDPRLDTASIADAHYLGRALLNLAGNAVKFTEIGQVVIRVMVLDATPNRFFLRFSVEDTGIGISAEDQARIFDPFVQLDTGPARRFAGTGLGLSICKDVVELMGGKLRVSSALGRGSRFWFDVDFPRAELPEAQSAQSLPELRAATAPRRILVVDDNVTNVHLLREILEQDGHIVTVATSGQDALELLAVANPAPEIIFLDFNLGDMAGTDVLDVYQVGVRDPAPVYFLTADLSADSMSRLRATAAKGVLGKPVRLAEIRETLAEAFPVPASGEGVARALRAVPVLFIDTEVLAEVAAVSRRPEFLGEMVERAVTDIERTRRELLVALEAGQWDAVQKLAHALKGVAHQMGAFRLKNIAAALMEMDAAAIEASRTRFAAEVTEVSEASVLALREACAELSRTNREGKAG